MARGNRTTHAILGFLTWGPMSGYEIRKRVEESIGNFWSVSFGQIYPELRRLEAEGLFRRDEDLAGLGDDLGSYSVSGERNDLHPYRPFPPLRTVSARSPLYTCYDSPCIERVRPLVRIGDP